MSRIGFIGTGHIAAPMVRHLAGKGHRIAVTKRNAEISAMLAADRSIVVSDASGVLAQSEIVFLCLCPHHAEDVLAGLNFRADHQIVSVMAGIGEAQLRKLCAPAENFVQTIPLGFLQQGGCPLAAYGNTTLLGALFEPQTPVVAVGSEPTLNAHFAIRSTLPDLLDFMTASAGLLAAMDKGAAGCLAAERDALATPNTLSLQMVEALCAGKANETQRRALDASETRLNDK